MIDKTHGASRNREAHPDDAPAHEPPKDDIDVLRREALAKLGGLTGVTSATVLTLLLSDKASAQSLGLPPPPP